jgi:hypothetical protein
MSKVEMGRDLHTLAAHSTSIDAGAAHHHVVDDREAALTTNPLALAVLDLAIGEDSSFVEFHASTVELPRERNLIGVEKLPARPIDDFVGSVSENVDNGVGAIEDSRIVGEVCSRANQQPF